MRRRKNKKRVVFVASLINWLASLIQNYVPKSFVENQRLKQPNYSNPSQCMVGYTTAIAITIIFISKEIE